MGSFFPKLAIIGLLFAGITGTANASEGHVTLQISDGIDKHSFQIEIADDPDERAQGLMFRESMPENAGMLFIYERPSHASFWMKNTQIPLDMIFIGNDGIVRQVSPDAVPFSLEPVRSKEKVRYVLEINAGLSAQLGIEPGDRVSVLLPAAKRTAPE